MIGSRPTPQHQKILALLACNPMTCWELERLGWSHQTASARLSELREKGCIKPVGLRKTGSGRMATVWAISEEPVPAGETRAERANRVAAIIAPFAAKAGDVAGRFEGLPDDELVIMTVPLGACRALAKMLEA